MPVTSPAASARAAGNNRSESSGGAADDIPTRSTIVRDRSHDVDDADAEDLRAVRCVVVAAASAREELGSNSARLKVVELNTSGASPADVRKTQQSGRDKHARDRAVAVVEDGDAGVTLGRQTTIDVEADGSGDGTASSSQRGTGSSSTSSGDIDSSDDQDKVAYKRPGSKTAAAAAASTRAPDCAERPLLYFTTGDAVLRAGVLHAARALGVYKIVDGSRTQKMGHVVDRQRYAAPAVFVVGRRPRRSVRLLLSMAQGAWVVRDAWLLDSLSARCWMPCEQYVPSAFPGVLAARRSKADGGQLLNGLRVGYVGNLSITVDEFCQLVEAAGGCFANLCVEVFVQGTGCGSGLTRGAVPVVNQRWLPDSIARWECLSYDDYSDTL